MKWSLALFFTCFFSSFSAQETFLQKNLYTLWERDGKEINFLLSCGVNNSFAGIEDPKKFTFGFTYEAIDESQSLASLTSLECCMCSYTIITKNTRDTLRLEYGGRGDFGPESIITHTFYVEGEHLVQLEIKDENTPVKHIWEPSPSRALSLDSSTTNTLYSHSWSPLNFRATADLSGEILGKIHWGESVEILEEGVENVEVGLNFAANFPATDLEYRKHMLNAPFTKVLYRGISGYVYEGFLGKGKPFDFESFFRYTNTPAHGMEFAGLIRKDSELIWEEKIELGQGDEGIAYKNFSGYADGVVLHHWYDGKHQGGIVIELPVETLDDFYVTSNSLLRFLSKDQLANVRNAASFFSIDFAEYGPFISTQISDDQQKMFIRFNHGWY